MEFMELTSLSEGGSSVVLLDAEVVMKTQAQVAVYECEEATTMPEGILQITSHRICWLREDRQAAFSLSLQRVAHFAPFDARFNWRRASPKLDVYVLSPAGTREERFLRFSFRNGGRDDMLTELTKAISVGAWKRVAEESSKRTPAVDRERHGVGISGLIRKAESESRERDDTLAEAFTSLDSLMALAQPLVVLSRRLAAAADNGDELGKHNDLQVAMLQIGIANPVTKDAAGQMFHEELARQLADFSEQQLAASPGNMITLPDLYCVFNRARGTELISPDDLVRACSLFERLGLQVRMRRFPSGVLVVQSSRESDEHLSKKLLAHIRQHGPQSALQVSLGLGMAVSLAREQLLTAESLGFLCRDESIEGLVFYPNEFPSFNLMEHVVR
eukprot:CAMPEP_0177653048 /NCGR_PEP_ID=MMETSP0447-20121125/13500_1 /TAXON_ID=0 /ORGANISM="Stygamoeba regulata, Strain BSH-02190019" /LENGTH=388 /DNA_ID=CAMNT_0019156423 /DNA_START=37 /DNA_END=1203 /DNA_ORIENTATION=+